MKVLILGSESFVGNNLVDGLSKNYEIYTADLLPNSHHKNYQQMDITNFESVKTVVKEVDIVVNLVANTLVSSIEDPRKNAEVNILGLLNVLEACKANNIKKVIFTSASSLIGQTSEKNVKEDYPPLPKTAYGITKLASEHYLRLYYELYKINYVIFRFFNIYGPYQNNGLIPSFYQTLKNKKPLTIFGKGDQIRDFVYIKDIIPFFSKAIETNIANNKIYNLGTGKATSIKEIIETMSKIMGILPKIEYKQERAGEIGNFIADTTLLFSTFGLIPNTNIGDGLQKTIEWLNNNFETK